MREHRSREHHTDTTRMTIDFPSGKHKELKATAALLGMPMKEFILNCVMEKLGQKIPSPKSQEEEDAEAFDRGMKSIREQGGITLKEMKKRLGIK